MLLHQLLLVLSIAVAAVSATKGSRRTSAGVRRSLQQLVDDPVKSPVVPSGPLDKDEKTEDSNTIKEEKEKKEKKDKKCKKKEAKVSKAPSTTPPPPPPPGPKPIETESNLVGGGGFGSDAATTTTNFTSAASDEDGMIVGGNPLVSSAENTTTAETDLPFCTDEENPEGLSTRGSNVGKASIAASALGLITILLGYMGWKRFRNRKSSDDGKIAVANLY